LATEVELVGLNDTADEAVPEGSAKGLQSKRQTLEEIKQQLTRREASTVSFVIIGIT
jgi:hypothetical protein